VTFNVTAPARELVVANGKLDGVDDDTPTVRTWTYSEGVPIPAYCMVIAVGEYARVEPATPALVPLAYFVPQSDAKVAALGFTPAAPSLKFFSETIAPYPYEKLALIVGATRFGGMENSSAIIFPSTLLGARREVTRMSRAFNIPDSLEEVVAHEIAHQWFGDLVTMAWWDNLWLNEGFARWMQTFVADDLHPEWETSLQASSIFELGKQADAVPSTHPVVQEVLTADQAEEAFDFITYDKGAAIITMMNAYVGRDHFRDGVRRYMQAHAFGNTVDSDLWSLMQQAVGKPILTIERDLTRQSGVPLVIVSRTAQGAHLLEGRFAQDPATIKNEPHQVWRLPLVVESTGGDGRTVLLRSSTDLTLELPVLVNAGQLGYARVLYDNDSFGALEPALGKLQPIDQLGLLNDAFALGTAGYAPVTRIVSLPAALPADANPIVWGRAIVLLTEIDRHYADTPERAAFRAFALRLLAPLATRLGDTAAGGEPSNITILRASLSVAQSTFGDATVIESARKSFGSDSGTAAEQRTALTIVAAHADAATFDALVERAQTTVDPLQKQHVFAALAGVTDLELARRMVDIALSDRIPAGGSPEIIEALARRHPHRHRAGIDRTRGRLDRDDELRRRGHSRRARRRWLDA